MLGLSVWDSPGQRACDERAVRRAARAALLGAHPDKRRRVAPAGGDDAGAKVAAVLAARERALAWLAAARHCAEAEAARPTPMEVD